MRVLKSFVEDPANHYSSQITITNYDVYRLKSPPHVKPTEKPPLPSEACGSDPLFPEVRQSKFQPYATEKSVQLLNSQ